METESSNGHPNAGGGDASPGASRDLIKILLRFVEELGGSADGLIEVHVDRLRLSVRRRLVRGTITAGVAVCATVWLGAGTLALLRGACAGLTTLWGGREWLGDLTGGLLAVTLAACALMLHLRLSTRRELAGLKAKYERIRNQHGRNEDTAASAGDGRGVAGSRGEAGDPGDRGIGATPG